ncbi:MAG: hypothetical protein HZC12_10435 [Nitrospirae bacterium]|nr:hypothetical protein [Nitrospirota bacterium]
MRGKEIPEWTLIKSIPEEIYEGGRFLTYMWKRIKSDAEELIKIDIVESVSWHRAHETLLELLGEYQALQLPDAASRKIELGDVAYIGFGETIQSAIFARANMIVRIHSVGKQNVSVVDIAKQMDNLFVTKPKLSEKGVIPEIELFSSERTATKRGERVALNIKARDPLDRPLWYKFIAEQGEIFVEAEKVWFLPEKIGQPQISLFAVNENGFVSGKSLVIKVE